MDTFIFVVRQKWSQISFLHVYHHSSITIVTSLFLNYDINGDCYVPALINSTVHVLMYSHYYFASIGVQTWWKRYLTQMQLIQFAFLFVYPIYQFFAGPSCGYPDFL